MAHVVAETILEQLGGRRFIAMTGAKDFVGDETSLRFRLPKAKDGINRVLIRLEPSDTYTVKGFRFQRYSNGKLPTCKLKSEHTDIYCEQLRTCFESMTGLRTSL